jgi:hypothetical protein
MATTLTAPNGFLSKSSKEFAWNLLILIVLSLVAAPSIARPVHVKAYTRKDGTSVRAHTRNDPRTQGSSLNITRGRSINSVHDYTTSLNKGKAETRLVLSKIKQAKSDCELTILQMNQIQQGQVVRILGNDCFMVLNEIR